METTEKVSPISKNNVKVTTTEEVITPAIAQKYLALNELNRTINSEHVKFLTKQMRSGEWRFTGDPIRFSSEGYLIDGQHRLHAVIKSGLTIKAIVMRGLEPDAFKVIDYGKPRSTGDMLSIEGFRYPQHLSAMIKFITIFDRNMSVASLDNAKGRHLMTNAQVSEFAAKHGDSLLQSHDYGYNKNNKIMSSTILASLHYIFKRYNPEKASEFCTRLADGISLQEGDPIYVLRNKLIAEKDSRRPMTQREMVALTIKAWIAFVEGRKIAKIWWNTDEPFPSANPLSYK